MHGRKTTALLDIQYHKTGMGNIIVKELSVMRADSWRYHHFVFSSPISLELMDLWQAKFVQKHINGIDYNMVGLPYHCLVQVLESIERNRSVQVVLIKGLEKFQFIRKYLSKAVLLPDEPSYGKMKTYRHNCTIHSPAFTCCALHHVIQLLMYLEKQDYFL